MSVKCGGNIYRNLWRALLLERVGPQSRGLHPSRSLFFQDLGLVNGRSNSRRQFLSTATAHSTINNQGSRRQISPTKYNTDKYTVTPANPDLIPQTLGFWLQTTPLADVRRADVRAIEDIFTNPNTTTQSALARLEPENISVLYRLLAKYNCMDLMKQVHMVLEHAGHKTTETDLKIWFDTYIKSDQMDGAVTLMNELITKGVDVSWDKILLSNIDIGELEVAQQTIKKLAEKYHIQCDANVYKNLIKAFLNRGKQHDRESLGHAIRTFQLMVQTNTEADGETYSAFIEAYIEDSLANWKDDGHDIRISTIDRLYEAILTQDNFAPPSSLWASLIHFYAKNGELSKAEQIYQDYKKTQDSTSTDVMIVVEYLIKRFSKRRLLISANSLFYELVADGHKFDASTIARMVEAHGYRNDLEAAEQLLSDSQHILKSPSLKHYLSAMREYIRLHDIAGARRIYDKVQDQLSSLRWEDRVYMHNLLLTGYCHLRDIRGCEKFWNQMGDRDPVSYNIMLEAYSTCGLWDDFAQLLDKMHQNKVQMDSRTKSILIFTQLRQDNVQKAEALINEYVSAETMRKKGANLVGAINAALQCRSLQGDLEACQKLFDCLDAHGLATGPAYQSLMFCLGNQGNLSELRQIYKKAAATRMRPEPALDRVFRQWLKMQ
ncbi:hypothetical protein NQZ79_g5476 [Umbelopsis isabellina]|nr:hypothetical protein NQZ79_g5476 [Umbelopsis isabellina]